MCACCRMKIVLKIMTSNVGAPSSTLKIFRDVVLLLVVQVFYLSACLYIKRTYENIVSGKPCLLLKCKKKKIRPTGNPLV